MKKNVFIIILVIIVLGLGGYLVYDKVLSKDEVKKEKTETKEVKSDKNAKEDLITLDFDSSKSLNTKDFNYVLDTTDHSLDMYASLSQEKIMFSYENDTVKAYYLDKSNTNEELSFEHEISIEKEKVADIYIGGFGQAVGLETLFFLMNDGTVEYMPIYDAIKNNNYKSYGKLEGVEKVVKFLSATGVPKEAGSGFHTVLAMRSDSSFYDLMQLIPRQQYYKIEY